jgi:hypothetical protein
MSIKNFLYSAFLLLQSVNVAAQTNAQDSALATASNPIILTGIPDSGNLHPHQVNKTRLWVVGGAHVALLGASFFALNRAWYSDYPATSFHFFDDFPEWNQMDKMGHMWTAYTLSRLSGGAWKYTGMNPKTAVWLGGASAMAYQSVIEVLDGFSAEWGFSPYDMIANVIGAGAYVSQELGWKEQRIQIKFSYWPHDYPDDLIYRRDDLFGTTTAERILKDYNSQTYWLSVNPWSFDKSTRFWPRWLNISAGYSSDLMLGGRENKWTDANGVIHDYTSIPRIRRFYLAPDIDFTKFRTRSKVLKTVFFVLNMIKIPAPTLEYNTEGKIVFHAIYF